jgi:heat shock transcription factor
MVGCGDVKDAGKLVPAPFLVKTYRLVDDPSTDHIVSWGDQNNTFVVWRPKEFSASLLPSYFNHTNFSSFVRQLNNYGFRKTVRGRCEFSNKLFWKGQQHLLSHIQRKKVSSPSRMQMEYGKSSSVFRPISSTQHSDVPTAAPPSLSDLEKETLRRNNSLLLSEIARLQNICSRDIRLLVRHNTGNPPLIDIMDRTKIDDASPSSSMTDVTEEVAMRPHKLFGVLLY